MKTCTGESQNENSTSCQTGGKVTEMQLRRGLSHVGNCKRSHHVPTSANRSSGKDKHIETLDAHGHLEDSLLKTVLVVKSNTQKIINS